MIDLKDQRAGRVVLLAGVGSGWIVALAESLVGFLRHGTPFDFAGYAGFMVAMAGVVGGHAMLKAQADKISPPAEGS